MAAVCRCSKSVARIYGITLSQFCYHQAIMGARWSLEERQKGEVGGDQINREDYEPINEHHRTQWPPEAQYQHRDQCRGPLLEVN